MRLINADALKEFVDNGRVCDICPDKKQGCADSCNFPDTLTPLWEKVIDNAPTVNPSLNLDNITEEDIEKFKTIWQRMTSKGLLVINEERPQGELNKKHTCDSCIHYDVCEYAVYRSEIICDDYIADMRGVNNG